MTTKKRRTGSRVARGGQRGTKRTTAAKTGEKPAMKEPVSVSLVALTSQGLDRLRARVNAIPASGASTPKKTRLLEALARLEADYERVLKEG